MIPIWQVLLAVVIGGFIFVAVLFIGFRMGLQVKGADIEPLFNHKPKEKTLTIAEEDPYRAAMLTPVERLQTMKGEGE